jgi:hypothetical protein
VHGRDAGATAVAIIFDFFALAGQRLSASELMIAKSFPAGDVIREVTLTAPPVPL